VHLARLLESLGHSFRSSLQQKRYGLLAAVCLVAMLGLLPAAMSHGIGSDSQRPFAIVTVGGLLAGCCRHSMCGSRGRETGCPHPSRASSSPTSQSRIYENRAMSEPSSTLAERASSMALDTAAGG